MSVDLSIDTMNTIPMTIEDDNEIGMTAGDSQIIEAVSPKVELEAVTGGTKMTVTDVDGEHVATIMDGVDGQDGTSAYVHIKWSTNQPTQDSDMKDSPDNYIGIYSGDSATAPTTYTSYTWYKYKGETGAAGQDGADGTSAYAYVRYSATEPTQDSDMKTTPDAWMGIYSGDSATAPTTYTSYTWYKIKGETGATGQTGPTGPGVPNGGTTGQVLVKTSNADQATAWADAPTQATMRKVPVSIAVGDWSGSGSSWTATFLTAYVTSSSIEVMYFDSSFATYAKAHIDCEKKSGGGGLVFTSTKKPTGLLTGNAIVWDNDDGKIPTLLENTVVEIANGGTGQSTLAGAKSVLGITALSDHFAQTTKWKSVAIGSDVLGTSFSPTSKNIGTVSSLFGISSGQKIVSITVREASLTPASCFIVGIFNSSVFLAATQSCTLSSSAVFEICYHD